MGKFISKFLLLWGGGLEGVSIKAIRNPILVPFFFTLGYWAFYSAWLQPGQMIASVTVPAVTCPCSICFLGLNSHPPSTLAKAISLQGRVQSKIKQWWLKAIPQWSRVRDLSYNRVVSFALPASPRATLSSKEGVLAQRNKRKSRQKKKGDEGWQGEVTGIKKQRDQKELVGQGSM